MKMVPFIFLCWKEGETDIILFDFIQIGLENAFNFKCLIIFKNEYPIENLTILKAFSLRKKTKHIKKDLWIGHLLNYLRYKENFLAYTFFLSNIMKIFVYL